MLYTVKSAEKTLANQFANKCAASLDRMTNAEKGGTATSTTCGVSHAARPIQIAQSKASAVVSTWI